MVRGWRGEEVGAGSEVGARGEGGSDDTAAAAMEAGLVAMAAATYENQRMRCATRCAM